MLENGRYQQAITHYEETLTGLYEHDPDLLLGLATAQFRNDQFEDARASLERLIEHNPEYKSADGHLLYARAVEACGDGGTGQSDRNRSVFFCRNGLAQTVY